MKLVLIDNCLYHVCRTGLYLNHFIVLDHKLHCPNCNTDLPDGVQLAFRFKKSGRLSDVQHYGAQFYVDENWISPLRSLYKVGTRELESMNIIEL